MFKNIKEPVKTRILAEYRAEGKNINSDQDYTYGGIVVPGRKLLRQDQRNKQKQFGCSSKLCESFRCADVSV
jgi:hypothetical protein